MPRHRHPSGPRPQGTPDGRDIAPWTGRARARALARVKAQGARHRTPCVICHQPIDYSLEYPHPDSCSVQHIIARKVRPDLTWDPSNWGPGHLVCNQAAGPRPVLDLGITDT